MGVCGVRRVGLERSTAQGWVDAVLWDLPGTLTGLKELVSRWRSVDHVGDPSMPKSASVLSPNSFDCEVRFTYQPGSIWSG